MEMDSINQQTYGDGEAWENDGEYEANANNQLSEHQAQQEPYSVDKEIAVPGDTASDDGTEYDPESVDHILPPPEQALASLSQPKPSKTTSKTASGFVVDSSDDDGDEEESDVQDVSQSQSVAPVADLAPSGTTHSAKNDGGSHQVHNPSNGKIPSGTPVSAESPAILPKFQPDMIAILEQRVKSDPRGDIDAWLDLMKAYCQKNRIEDLRNVYSRFLDRFPHSSEIWVENINMELGMNHFAGAEDLFRKCLMTVQTVPLWTTYLDYIRRRHDLNDATGEARRTVNQAYEFVLDNVGFDKDSGPLWQDYIHFVRSGPGQVGGTNWQDQQKMDQLRRAYQRAICIPIVNLVSIWKDYDQFEMSLNKATGRKFIQERSPGYITARSAYTALENTIRGLSRTTIPRLPPAPGFEGDQEFVEQVELWERWIAWEKDDPLGMGNDDPKTLQQRILHVYKQALMALRFWPPLWADAADWCFENDIVKDGKEKGMEFLQEGIKANPESVLLALKFGERIEISYPVGDGEESKISKGKAVREPYDQLLNHLYGMVDAVKERESTEITKIENTDGADLIPIPSLPKGEDEEEDAEARSRAKEEQKKERISIVRKGFSVQTELLKKTITFVWVALFRAMRRIQGKGSTKAGAPYPGARGLFQEARSRGRLTSEIYAAVAQVEWNVYRDPSATKIFDRGSKLFPTDEIYLLEYLKHLHAQHDTTNARVVFETCANKLTSNPELVHKAKPLYAYFHKYESYYGELSQVMKLEKRMNELFPEDPKLARFSARFSAGDGFGLGSFNPVNARLIISPAAQMKPKLIMPSIEEPQSVRSTSRPPEQSPRPHVVQTVNSPKRPLPVDDDDFGRPLKIARGESPLKGAAGRRLDQQRRHGGGASTGPQPAPIPRNITFMLGLIPGSNAYLPVRYRPVEALRLLQTVRVPSYSEYRIQNQNRDQPSRQLPTHNRQASAEYIQYSAAYSRNSPAPTGRPISPYGRVAAVPIVSAAATYRNSPLRPDSNGSFDTAVFPPPASDGGTSWPLVPNSAYPPRPGQQYQQPRYY